LVAKGPRRAAEPAGKGSGRITRTTALRLLIPGIATAAAAFVSTDDDLQAGDPCGGSAATNFPNATAVAVAGVLIS
jgi:hypothetical protein